MKTVNQVSKLTGVSVRTLHHYDTIGLLKPTAVTQAGYRLYDDTALERLQQILLFRELEFSLKDIKAILESPNFDREKALKQQIKLLTLKKEHIENLIALAREIETNGGYKMDFKAFDTSEIEKYAAEAKERWGQTAAYKEYQQKTENQNDNRQKASADKLMQIFTEIGKIKHLSPDSDEAQKLIEKLQNCITENYYTCTKQILQGLGQMYVADERFKANIDQNGGEGTAEFAEKAITIYCSK
ncbi:MAG: MerR family transcriptional regulator [Acutalibacteraceae bacterium]